MRGFESVSKMERKIPFETCFFIGRCIQAFKKPEVHLIKRVEEKQYICGTALAKDGDIRQELLDMFEPDLASGKRPKEKLKGFKADMYSALAIAITCARKLGI
ncbi:MAG: hypothetical protein EOM23_07475 [Candidatus Moranbacteria bacterium]|nr:hypothetical protein [Candidatus Moranbacteria bacterium]